MPARISDWALLWTVVWPVAAVLGAAEPDPATNAGRYQFRTPRPMTFLVPPRPAITLLSVPQTQWVSAQLDNGSDRWVQLGHRLAIELRPAATLAVVIKDSPLRLARTLAPNLFILEAPDAWTALDEARRLARSPEVLTCYPVMRLPKARFGAYAPAPRDPYFTNQWFLENRGIDGTVLGLDLNVRAAWPATRGEGVTIGVADDGVELTHPEFVERAAGEPHFNFITGETNGMPGAFDADHATAVAGLALAEADNHRGIAGVAPRARLASWVIFGAADIVASDEQMMDMFQYHSNSVAVQNHSWGNPLSDQLMPSLLESVGLSNAIAAGRNGRGVIMVHAGGNGRQARLNANDDGYAADPRVIAVGAIRQDGRVTSYSNPGACLLVAAPSGDEDEGFDGLFTTDRQGAAGYNQDTYTNDLADYTFGVAGFSGTSASTPLVSGLAALLVSANPNLGYRDVQQILILSARHFDFADPDLTTNAAGLRVSHNAGFGVPDAGRAVGLARRWKNRPPLTRAVFTSTNPVIIPETGLEVVYNNGSPTQNLVRVPAWPGDGRHAEQSTPVLPIVDAGQATNTITADLSGKAALIQRGVNLFQEKIDLAAQAGAAFVVVYNNRDANDLVFMGGTEFTSIPAVFIGENDGERLHQVLATNLVVRAQLRVSGAVYSFAVPDTLLCEHVGVRITADYPQRSDLRIHLRSPQGTLSVLQEINGDTQPGPDDWTYYSTHHFYESSAGTWTVSVVNEVGGNSGTVQSVSLIINGVPLEDTDRDGLDDRWETAFFQALDYGLADDPDHDGYSNALEQILGTDPTRNEAVLQADLSLWNEAWVRLSWPSVPGQYYSIWQGPSPGAPLSLITNVTGGFPQTEWFAPATNAVPQFFRIQTQGP